MSRIAAPNISHRIIMLLCLVFGIVGFTIWHSETEPPPSRILVEPLIKLEPPERQRDLWEYEFGGHSKDCLYSDEKKKCEAIRENTRKFIFDAWKAKRKSYAVVDYFCIDCAPSDTIFVEPDQNGKWQITLVRYSGAMFHVGDTVKNQEHIAVDLRRRRATKNDYGLGPGEPLLSFIDKFGDEIGAF